MAIMNEYKVYDNQTLFDICADYYGHIDNVTEVSILNQISPTETIPAGTILILENFTSNYLVKKVLKDRNIIPATELTIQDAKFLQSNFGIGKMTIGTTFIVS